MDFDVFANLLKAATDEALAIVLVVVIIWFFLFRVWPYWTKEYMPTKRAHELAIIEASQLVAHHLENQAVALQSFAVALQDVVQTLTAD